MMAEMNELTDSSDSTATKTTTTIISPDSTDIEQPFFEDAILTSPTSSSSMYAIRSPSPPFHAYFKYPTHLKAPAQYHLSDSEEEGVTLTEIVEIHRIPSVALITIDNNNFQTRQATATEVGDLDIESQLNNNNTSCSLSSTLTDSKTLDIRTPIVV